ncbi:hypothetical protein K3725_09255 [Leisingera sp. S132]|uniref:hypothetical protein n=1 Tax=Leisingera sp. S132 TaxID=2867016 RepID=UPI0021A2A913|nr:hypothetical protein [Leisingera sp. S132]UWQ81158.1 hypothetical protein K3725_09255 [Leisingera sp. S132]
MFRFGSLTTACAALALAANLALTTPAAAHDSGNDAARAIAGLITLGIIVKSLDNDRDRHRGRAYYHQPRQYHGYHGARRHHATRNRHHFRRHSGDRHRSRHGGYYYHRH